MVRSLDSVMLVTLPSDGENAWPLIMIFLAICMIFLLPEYIIGSLGKYRIACRRGIRLAWVSWVPLLNAWVVGCISDQYQYVVRGKVTNRRNSLLILQLLRMASYVALLAFFLFAVNAFEKISGGSETQMMVMGMAVVLIEGVLAIVAAVLQYMALYDLFRFCEPKNAALYLGISLAVHLLMPSLSVVRRILILVCSQKDFGMPYRKPQPAQEAWAPVEPPKEPWENNPEA